MTKYVPAWEGHHTTELYEKYPLQMITPHPVTASTHGGWQKELD